MTFLTLPPQDRSPQWIAQLTAVWEASVRATHHFLDEDAIQAIAPEVPQTLRQVPYLTVAVTESGAPAGFLGVAGHTLEMLFLAPEHLGTGLGTQLFHRGMADCYIAQITVNEQNQRALDFYLRRSYKVHHRTPTDQQGRPYPLLYLTLSCY